MSENESKPVEVELDDILKDVGTFGKYQYYYIFLILLSIFSTSIHSTNYIFVAPDTQYRCKIPICESSEGNFDADWLDNVIPKDDKCHMYEFVNNTFLFWKTEDSSCPKEWFNNSTKIRCEEYHFKEKYSFIDEMSIPCEDWKRALIGTINSIGTLISLPFIGYASDRFGRKIVLVFSCAIEGSMGLIRSFSVNYWMYISFEFLETLLGSGTFCTAYIIALELLVPKHRALAGTIINIVFGIGQAIMAAIGIAVPYWRTFLQIIYTPLIVLLVNQWLLDESPRWLLSKKYYQEVVNIVKKIAKVNGKPIPDVSMEGLLYNASNELKFKEIKIKNDKKQSYKICHPYIQVIKSKTLTIRLIMCSFWWITCVFCSYGLSINTMTLPGSTNVNFVIVSLAEIPAHVIGMVALNKIGRKWTLFMAYILGGVTSLAFAFMCNKPDLYWASMVIYFISKMFVTLSFSSIYLYTSEIFPTTLRQSLLSFCSTVGRIGTIVAPLTPLLVVHMEQLPSILFGSTCILSAILMLFSPETLDMRLPETIGEAENMDCLKIKNEVIDSKNNSAGP